MGKNHTQTNRTNNDAGSVVRMLNMLAQPVITERDRLHRSGSLWSGSKAKKINDALQRLNTVITITINGTSSNLWPRPIPMRNGDKDVRQFSLENFHTVHSLLDFQRKEWVEEYSYSYYDAADNEVYRTVEAHWDERPSIREALAIGRYNFFNTLFNSSFGTLWGKSRALTNVEAHIASQEESPASNQVVSV